MKNNLDEVLERRNTSCVKYSRKNMMKRAEDAIVMTLADMDFPACPAITEALVKRAQFPVYGYEDFSEDVPELMADWYNSHYQSHLKAEDCIFTPSVNTAISWCLQTFTKENDKVLIQDPSYSPFRHAIETNERIPVFNPLNYQNNAYTLDKKDFEEKVKEADVFILCTPHNPTGHVYSQEELAFMLETCKENKVLVIADEIHADWCFKPFTSASSVDPDVITIVSASKTFNLQGMQTSAIFIPDETMRNDYQKTLDKLHWMNSQTFSHTAYRAAYTHGEDWLKEAKAAAERNTNYMKQYFEEHKLGIKVCSIESTFLAWLDLNDILNNDEEVVDLFENQCHIYGSSGSHYHIEGAWMRLNIALSIDLIKEVCERLKKALQK